jgi:channel protein (hemolysin III family)
MWSRQPTEEYGSPVPALASAHLYAIPGFADPFSSVSHLLAALVCLFLGIALVRRGLTATHDDGSRPGVGHVLSLAIFAFSAVFLLSMSGVYHMLGPGGAARNVLQRLDHAAIFILIAGTITPVHAILFRGPWRWGMLAFVWTLTAIGVTLKSIFFESFPQTVGIILYLGMGWLGLASMIMLARRYGLRTVMPLAIGGLVYTAGAAIELIDPPPLVPGVVRSHELFHIAVLIGLALHWWFVWITAALRTTSTLPE